MGLAAKGEFGGAEELGCGEVGVVGGKEAGFDLQGLIENGEGGGLAGAGEGFALAVEGLGVGESLGKGEDGQEEEAEFHCGVWSFLAGAS